jgi:hypothetical protein
MDRVRVFRLIPVPMYLDDPRWRRSWRRKPCLLFHFSEELARDAAARFFSVTPASFPTLGGEPWTDPKLAACDERLDLEDMVDVMKPGVVRDLRGGIINRDSIQPGSMPREPMMNARRLQVVLLLILGAGLLLWIMGQPHVQIAHLREQGRLALSDLRSGPDREHLTNPLHLFQASLAEASPAEAAFRGTVYVPAYSAIRVASGRTRINLATTLSVHNTSRKRSLLLERVDYHNTEGELVQAHLERPVALRPLGTIEIFVANDNLDGGTGANFIVDWAADAPISEPVVEAVMIGIHGTTGYSFVSVGRSVRPTAPQ